PRHARPPRNREPCVATTPADWREWPAPYNVWHCQTLYGVFCLCQWWWDYMRSGQTEPCMLCNDTTANHRHTFAIKVTCLSSGLGSPGGRLSGYNDQRQC